MLSVRIDSSDTTGIETKVRRGEFRFYLERPGDGKYVFKVLTESDRDEWISGIQSVIDVSWGGREGRGRERGKEKPC